MDALLRSARAARAVTTVRATNIPLWALIVVVIGGTVLLVTGVAFTLLFAQQCRKRRRRGAGWRRRKIVIDGREVSVYRGSDGSEETLGFGGAGVKKLRKKRRITDEGESTSVGGSSPIVGGDGDEEEGRHAGKAPVLPRISRIGSGLFSLAGSSSTKSRRERESAQSITYHGHRRQTSNPWVDEDAIHGPEMNVSPKGKKRGKGNPRKNGRRSWRRSIRESWPLRSMTSISPTLPRLAAFGSPALGSVSEASTGVVSSSQKQERSIGGIPMFRFQSHPMPSLPPPDEQQDPVLGSSPPRQLPKPPRQALIAANAEVAGSWSNGGMRSMSGGYRGSTKYYVYKDASGALRGTTLPPRVVTGAAQTRRISSTGDVRLEDRLREVDRMERDSVLADVASRQNRTSNGTLSKRAMLAPSAMSRNERGPIVPFAIISGIPNDSSATLVGSGTPSPPKSSTNKSHHRHKRDNSQNSILSEADSLYEDLSPGLGGYYHGLTSPTKPQMVRRHSAASSDDSAADHSLSTINEAASANSADGDDDNTRTTKVATESGNMSDVMRKMAELSGKGRRPHTTDDDPFVSLRNSPANSERHVNNNSHRPSTRGVHAFADAPRLPGIAGGSFSRSEITLHSLRSDSPLSTISGNSRSPEPRPRSRHAAIGSNSSSPHGGYKGVQVHQHTTPQGQRMQGAIYAPTSAVSSSSNLLNLHRRQLSTVHDVENSDDEEDDGGLSSFSTIPGIALTSPSDRERDSPSPSPSPISKRLAELRVRPSSPTLGRGRPRSREDREHTPDIAPPSVAISQGAWDKIGSAFRDSVSGHGRASAHLSYTSSTSTNSGAPSNWRRAAGEVRKLSDDTSSMSRYSNYEQEKMDALAELSDLINGEILHKPSPLTPQEQERQQFKTYSQLATVRLVPPEDYRLPLSSSTGPVLSTIAQLRRMNSQVSSYSNAASGYSDLSSSDGIATGGGVLPTLREEDSSRFVSPPRKREAARNYLAVGTMRVGKSSPKDAAARASVDSTVGAAPMRPRREGADDKENEKGVGLGLRLKMPNVDVDGTVLDTPAKRFLRAEDKSPERKSSESLGLYDADGFWISPERRARRQQQ